MSDNDRVVATPRGSRRGSQTRSRLVAETASSAAKRRPPSSRRDDASGTVTPGSVCSTPASAVGTPRTGSRKGSRTNEDTSFNPMLMPELDRAFVNIPATVEDPESDLDKFLADGDHIQVVVRLRGGEYQRQGYGTAAARSGLTSLTVFTEPDPRSYTFDFVAGENTTQNSLYQVIGPHLITTFLQGYNTTLLAYGQTNSGKTYSMLGTAGEGHGMIPRTIAAVLPAMLQMRQRNQLPAQCYLTAVEIFNESIVDLINPSTSGMVIREDSNRGMFVDGAQEVELESVEASLLQLRAAVANRRRGVSSLNQDASRSHLVVTLLLERQFEDAQGVLQYSYSRLNLVDLAGCERQRVETKSDRLRESSAINKSLSTLTKCVMSLTDQMQGKWRHVPYRDSKLTYLLQNSLGGNGKTVLLATISTAHSNVSETLSTLRFAHRAKSIKNPATVNSAPVSAMELQPQLLRQEVERIKAEYMSLMQQERGAAEQQAAQVWQQQHMQAQSELEQRRTELQVKDWELQQLRTQLQQIQAQSSGTPPPRPAKEDSDAAVVEGSSPCCQPRQCSSPRIAATRSFGASDFAELGVLELRRSMDATTRLEKLSEYRARLDSIMSQVQQRVDVRASRRTSTLTAMPSVAEEVGAASSAEGTQGRGGSTWNFEEDIALLRAEVEAQYMAATEQKSCLQTMEVELDALRREVQMKDAELVEAGNQVLEMQEALEQHESLMLQQQTQLVEKEREVAGLQRFKQETEQWHVGVRDYVNHLEQGMSSAQSRAVQLEAQLQQAIAARRNAEAAAEVARQLNESLQAEIDRLTQLPHEHSLGADAQLEQAGRGMKQVSLEVATVTYDIVANAGDPHIMPTSPQ